MQYTNSHAAGVLATVVAEPDQHYARHVLTRIHVTTDTNTGFQLVLDPAGAATPVGPKFQVRAQGALSIAGLAIDVGPGPWGYVIDAVSAATSVVLDYTPTA